MKEFKLIIIFYDDSRMDLYNVKDYSINDNVFKVEYLDGGKQMCDRNKIKYAYKEYI